MKRITVTVGSITYAIKARKLLWRCGVSCRVVRLESQKNGVGCTHGIIFDERDMYTVAQTLKENGINYSVYTQNNGLS